MLPGHAARHKNQKSIQIQGSSAFSALADGAHNSDGMRPRGRARTCEELKSRGLSPSRHVVLGHPDIVKRRCMLTRPAQWSWPNNVASVEGSRNEAPGVSLGRDLRTAACVRGPPLSDWSSWSSPSRFMICSGIADPEICKSLFAP